MLRAPLVTLALAAALAAGCLSSGTPPTTVTATPTPPVGDSSRGVTLSFAGDIASATPATPYRQTHAFDVGPGVLEVRVNFSWTLPVSDVQVQLLDPSGKDQGKGAKESDTTRAMATVDPPARGAWKLVVTSTRAVHDSYKALVTLTEFVPGSTDLHEVEHVDANGFRELNLIMEGNDSLDYAWAIRESGASAKFNIHSHADGKTTYHVEGTFAKTNGTFVAPVRQIYSLMWENTGGLPVTIDLHMSGKYRLHSHT